MTHPNTSQHQPKPSSSGPRLKAIKMIISFILGIGGALGGEALGFYEVEGDDDCVVEIEDREQDDGDDGNDGNDGNDDGQDAPAGDDGDD